MKYQNYFQKNISFCLVFRADFCNFTALFGSVQIEEKLKNMEYITDPYLEPFLPIIEQRNLYVKQKKAMLQGDASCLSDVCNSHLYYGLHLVENQWVFREWLPNATQVFFLCDQNDWRIHPQYELYKIDSETWEIRFEKNELKHGDLYKLLVVWENGSAERLPSHIQRVVQDEYTKIFTAQVWQPEPYQWKNSVPEKIENPLIYEAHIGMSSEQKKVASFTEFRVFVLPRIAQLGYNVIQLMAIQEHPYYGSFGYQVSNFFAVSSRYGTPEELKQLIDEAHGLGIRVILDIVHSHSVSNEAEGLGLLDGTEYQYFHAGERGHHALWGSRCFDYGKPQVLTFLLSNCKYWLEEFRFDGFRFDGVTSMLYLDHGNGVDFAGYEPYFNGNQDVDAITYLTLANLLIHELRPDAITIAEEVSGMPLLAQSFENKGIGFDFRMQMGVPDYWIKLLKEKPDDLWHIGDLYYELTNKRSEEKTISYAESHDQALVGDKTIFFRMTDKEIYTSMSIFDKSLVIERAIALHKMIRLITLATAGNGYLTFMGNEWGHPEWIDFPREGNDWSYNHARRQWSLLDDKNLRFRFLNEFDKAMVHLFAGKNQQKSKTSSFETNILKFPPEVLVQDVEKQILIFKRSDYLFVFNFSPNRSYSDYVFEVEAGKYLVTLNTDAPEYDGLNRVDTSIEHFTQYLYGKNLLSLYIPSRSGVVYRRE